MQLVLQCKTKERFRLILVRELLWDDWNEWHIARHNVSTSEVEEVCFGNPWVLRAKGKRKQAVYGQSDAGRFLLIILARRGPGIFYTVTARDMTETERRRYREHHRR